MLKKVVALLIFAGAVALVVCGAIHIFFVIFPFGVLMITAGLAKRLGFLTFGLVSDEIMERIGSPLGFISYDELCIRCAIGGIFAILGSFMSLFIVK